MSFALTVLLALGGISESEGSSEPLIWSDRVVLRAAGGATNLLSKEQSSHPRIAGCVSVGYRLPVLKFGSDSGEKAALFVEPLADFFILAPFAAGFVAGASVGYDVAWVALSVRGGGALYSGMHGAARVHVGYAMDILAGVLVFSTIWLVPPTGGVEQISLFGTDVMLWLRLWQKSPEA